MFARYLFHVSLAVVIGKVTVKCPMLSHSYKHYLVITVQERINDQHYLKSCYTLLSVVQNNQVSVVVLVPEQFNQINLKNEKLQNFR